MAHAMDRGVEQMRSRFILKMATAASHDCMDPSRHQGEGLHAKPPEPMHLVKGGRISRNSAYLRPSR